MSPYIRHKIIIEPWKTTNPVTIKSNLQSRNHLFVKEKKHIEPNGPIAFIACEI